MSSDLFNSLTTVLLAIVGLAIVATLVSKSANTAGILNAGGNAFGNALSAAEAPVSGGGFSSFGGAFNGSGFQDF